MSEELKPCPICKSESSGAFIHGMFVSWICNNCNLETYQCCEEEQARELWNTRPIEDALQARIDALEAKLRWIPVSERLPEVRHDRLYLCWIDNGIREPYWDNRTWFAAWKQFSGDGVTHWMDWEPEAPEVKE